jgi:hypothetical protein
MTETRFRFLVIGWFLVYVWNFSLPSHKQPPEIREALAYSARGAIMPPTANIAYLFLLVVIVTALGLLLFQPWARKLFVALLVVMIIVRALRGVAVGTALSATLSLIFTLLAGIIATLLYTGPVAHRFAVPENDLEPSEESSDDARDRDLR